jgi:uncharacterized DUF497 family protein
VAFEKADWTHRGEYIVEKHGLTAAQANAALRDPNRVVIQPDYKSKSGESVRVIGFVANIQALITVIVLQRDGVIHGVNAWVSNSRDQMIYREGHMS